ncbi:hypothetical protein E0Z10_g4637 [Xylaria hypoxylon]|uniref:HhH-GPD domain-containing protein n=1 Tax=Xylaria hypoxylon TaxID=37992 RepID=A0A4Z0YXG2_9PEZI|nr:hypothetical protein E0Z10_g4637 [Xylaria hypoxylon]
MGVNEAMEPHLIARNILVLRPGHYKYILGDVMEYSRCTDQLPTVNPRTNDMSNDFMFGFDVEDDDDREYLAEVAMYGIGHEDDIKGFFRLSLFQGMEEWEQAICCASAMKDRRSFHRSLDGQDVLTFLGKIYGVDKPCHATDTLSPPQRPGRPRAKRRSKRTCVSPCAETRLDIPVKKQRKVKNSKDSPYWDETQVPPRQQDSHSDNGPETKVIAKTLMKRKGSLEGAVPPTFKVPIGQPGYDTVMQICRDHELTPISLDGHRESFKNVLFIDTQGYMSEFGNDDTREAIGDPNLTLLESETHTTQVLDPSSPNLGPIRTTGQEDTGKANQSSDDEGKPPASQNQTPKRQAKSPYFAPSPVKPSKSPNKRPPRGTVSSLPFPRLDAPHFGLIQEELAHDPFRLLIAVTFLVRTTGKAAIPVFRALMEKYPTPSALAAADAADLVARIKHLGLGSVRAAAIQRYARAWLENPPRNGVRHAVKNYEPRRTDDEGGLVRAGSGDSAWEIGHMTQGAYALDSWRIFCRDVLRSEAADWKGAGREGEFQPEWMRVLPQDKELRACLRWMWMREGWQWDPRTGEKVVLSPDLRRAVQDGRVGYDDAGDLRILDAALDQAS